MVKRYPVKDVTQGLREGASYQVVDVEATPEVSPWGDIRSNGAPTGAGVGPDLDQTPIPAELDHLNNYQVTTAEAKLAGQTFDARATTIANTLGLPAQEVIKMCAFWLSHLPSADVNRWADREDLESAIWDRLLRNPKAKGNWEIAKLDMRCAYLDWYRNYRRMGSMGEYQAISLDREAFATEAGESDSLADYVVAEVDYVAEVDDRLHVDSLITCLPKPIGKILAMRLSGTPTTGAERVRWHRFISNPMNAQAMLGLVNGTLRRKPVWNVTPA